ncbi:branched-chain amino acid aminotransferase [Paramicrobacterium agarici]|uniref:Branched-chain-amino-acid aminotransferase n=1 Tax=Paramicrobacterium agarici TaxID=630514 RepID=A0A2A9DYA0_9MICO|nr:branched-chain amino acid aminotransferase [Microbacterium agarici]PFG31573.1 branched chain amino acid aminotransferase [Microbacterium agarici]TQO21490.1 branched chain amino acid aminotransferase [Microbacterium agarici]
MTTVSDAPALTFERTLNPTPATAAQRDEVLANPGFGIHFSDHMVAIDWTIEAGWHDARLQPYGPLQFDPGSAVLHYGQEVFEGLKAYRHDDGSIWTFRPEKNAQRLQRSARRLALPELPVDDFLASLKQIVAVDAAWVPPGEDGSLYLRPFMIANETFLGVRAAHTVAYYVIASPAGPYFSGGVTPVSIWLSTEYSRAGRGGTGAAKCGGNYAASLLPQEEALQNGCSQVLFLDAETGQHVDELGGMNVFFVVGGDTLVTPATSGSILEGVTRDSVIQLAKDRGLTVEERDITLDEWRDGVDSGRITEVFACGTAAVITPIAQVKSRDFVIGAPDAVAGEITMSLRKELTDIQHGRAEDRHGWLYRLDA